MKGLFKKAVSVLMAGVILSITPLCDIAPKEISVPGTAAAAETGGRYIKEVRIGMGEDDAQAKKELEAEGFTIMEDASGAYADLNKDAGSKSIFKRGANHKVVYLGYKTTSDASDAVTDLAVMNMLGGYSTADYDKLMKSHMDSQIKPFVDNFIAALEEYRENYKKPKNKLGHIRADSVRKALNHLTDDDTDGKPLGDLLLNKTKYELGDAAYNALSSTEKKDHADILTILMQANGQAVLTMEMLITKATDTSEDTWIDRFTKTTVDDLTERIKDENPGLKSQSDVMAELDKQYYDKAKAVLEKWKPFYEQIMKNDDTIDELNDNQESVEELVETATDMSEKEITEDGGETVADAGITVANRAYDIRSVGICAYLETVDYGDGTLLDYFSNDYSKMSSGSGIRKLYPLVDALSPGQIAGLDFLSFDDLITIATSDEETYKLFDKSQADLEAVSVYDGVDRDIYEEGGIALTSQKMRDDNATPDDLQPDGYSMSQTPRILLTVTIGLAVATAVTGAVAVALRFTHGVHEGFGYIEKVCIDSGIFKQLSYMSQNAGCGFITKSEVSMFKTFTAFKLISIGLAVISVIMMAVTAAFTIIDVMNYYDTNFLSIPKIMVDEVDIKDTDKNGNAIMKKNETAYYRAALCNRTKGDSSIEEKNYEAMKDRADLNGDIGRQWLALYWVKNKKQNPILADSLLYQLGGSGLPDGYKTGIHEFGSQSACNLNKKAYLFPDDPPSIKVFFKNADKNVTELMNTGSVMSYGYIALSGGCGVVIGAILMGLITSRKRKIKPVSDAK